MHQWQFSGWFTEYEKQQRRITHLWRFYQSPLVAHHFKVTPLLLFDSPTSPSRECFLQSLWSREALEICWLTHGECEMTLHCLNHSQYKGTGTSSPAAATFHVGAHERREGLSLWPSFSPRCFELTFYISSCAFVGDNFFSEHSLQVSHIFQN